MRWKRKCEGRILILTIYSEFRSWIVGNDLAWCLSDGTARELVRWFVCLHRGRNMRWLTRYLGLASPNQAE